MDEVQVVAKSEKGLVRKVNEDRFIATDNLLAVADGMGGHLAGEVAAQIAIDVIKDLSYSDEMIKLMNQAFQKANQLIYETGKNNKEQEGMGTTLTTIAVDGNKAYLAHVGDSRGYLIRDKEVTQLTEDHSYVNQLVAMGTISLEEAEKHPQRNILLRVMGIDKEVEVDQKVIDLLKGDRLVVASDGLFTDVPRNDIEEILKSGLGLTELAEKLIDVALAKGGRDNITVVIGEV